MHVDHRLRHATALLGALVILAAPAGAEALRRDCTAVCASNCVKPISIADRWDDVTPIPGHEAWANNGAFDRESYTDLNESGLWEPGEPFEDGNGNAQLDQEAYHPALTGYTPDSVPGNVLAPDGDLGRLLRLRPGPGDRNRKDTFAAIALPATNKGTPRRGARAYRDALAGCESQLIEPGDWLEVQSGSMAGPSAEAFAAMVAGDPDARWDEATGTIVGLRDPERSSRIVLIGLHDPRIARAGGHGALQLAKVAAFFLEAPTADGTLVGRLIKWRAPAVRCDCTCTPAEAFLRDCR